MWHLVKFPDSYCGFFDSPRDGFNGGGGGGDQQRAALHLRCLDASIGWRHLRRTVRHVVLMSGTLGTHEVLMNQLKERFSLLTAADGSSESTTSLGNMMMKDPATNFNSVATPQLPQGAAAPPLTNAATTRTAGPARPAAPDDATSYGALAVADTDDDDESDWMAEEARESRIARGVEVAAALPSPEQLLFAHVHPPAATRHNNFFRGGHVVDVASQARAVILPYLADGRPATITFETRKQPQFMASLVETLAGLIHAIPYGSLVFASSYAFLKDIFFAIRKHPGLVRSGRALIMEPGGGGGGGGGGGEGGAAAAPGAADVDEFTRTLDRFRVLGRKRVGATMFCVFRGKVSEGINLPDELTRGVICVGVPLRSYADPSVRAQKQYSGETWYRTDAMIAVNQAIGRALRHKNDWSCITLIDTRYADAEAARRGVTTLSRDIGELLPAWLRPHIKARSDVAVAITDMEKFVDDRAMLNADVADDAASGGDDGDDAVIARSGGGIGHGAGGPPMIARRRDRDAAVAHTMRILSAQGRAAVAARSYEANPAPSSALFGQSLGVGAAAGLRMHDPPPPPLRGSGGGAVVASNSEAAAAPYRPPTRPAPTRFGQLTMAGAYAPAAAQAVAAAPALPTPATPPRQLQRRARSNSQQQHGGSTEEVTPEDGYNVRGVGGGTTTSTMMMPSSSLSSVNTTRAPSSAHAASEQPGRFAVQAGRTGMFGQRPEAASVGGAGATGAVPGGTAAVRNAFASVFLKAGEIERAQQQQQHGRHGVAAPSAFDGLDLGDDDASTVITATAGEAPPPPSPPSTQAFRNRAGGAALVARPLQQDRAEISVDSD